MTEKNNGPLVNLIRKAVGLPTGTSACCGFPATTAPTTDAAKNDCCGAEPKQEKTSGNCCA